MAKAKAQALWARAARWIVGLGIAGLSCWLLARELDWQGVSGALGTADYRWVIVAILAIVATFLTRARRWQALLWQSEVRLRPAVTALLIGQALNMTLPMRSGDVVRATWIGSQRETGTVEALGSIAVEKAWEAVRGARRGHFMPHPPPDGCPSYCPATGFCWQYRQGYAR